jgi:PAS domain S-box-containing protein
VPRTQPVIERVSDERRFELLVQAVTDYAIYMLDPKGHIVSWNVGAERITGYRSDEIIGRHFSSFFTEEDRAAGKPAFALATALRTGRFEDESWRLRKDGSRFWAVAVLEAVHDETGRLIGLAKITRDITERRNAREALRESERRFRILIDGVVDYAIYMIDPKGRITNWNSGAQRIKGYSADEIIGENFSKFYTEEDRDAGLPQRALRIAATEGKFQAEGWRVRKDGSRMWASVVIDPVYDEKGELIGFAKVTRDNTEWRAAQRKLEEAREQLFQAQKMEAVGQLTGGVAHDFNNLLTVILGSADLAERVVGDNEKLKRLIGNMRHAAQRGESLTKQLLAFSRRQPLRPERIDLPQQVKGLSDLLSRSLRGDIGIVTEIEQDLWPIVVDASQLELALLNVGLNARDAMPDGGTLRLAARNVSLNSEADGLQGDYVAISISDTGEGMAEDVKARAFEPFFTTKGIGRGSGLGLSQAYGFARQSGGTVTIDSMPGHGTTVTFYLPTGQAVPAPAPKEEPRKPRRAAGSGTVLLVEDEPAVLELALGLLQEAGYTVKTATSAGEALALLRQGDEIDVVFTDIMMPGGMNGAELARVVRREFPGVFILLATGYADVIGTIAQEFPLITKPYGREMLLHTLATILGESD